MKQTPRERGFLQCRCETWEGFYPNSCAFCLHTRDYSKKGNNIVPIAGLHETRQPCPSAHGRTKVLLRPCQPSAGSAGETGWSVIHVCILLPSLSGWALLPCSEKCMGTGSHYHHHHDSPEDAAAAKTTCCSTHRLALRRQRSEMKSSPCIQAFPSAPCLSSQTDSSSTQVVGNQTGELTVL